MDAEVLRNKIRSKIEQRNMSVRQAAKASGISSGTLQNFLAGVIKNPTFETLSALAKTLECDLTELVSSSNIVIKSCDYKLPWNAQIYVEAVEYVQELQDIKGIKLPSEEAIIMVKEIYYYSRIKERKSIDKDFAEWMFRKNIENET